MVVLDWMKNMLHPFKYFTRSLSLKKPLSNTICYLPRFYNTKSEQEESTSFGVYEFNGCKFPVKFKSFTSIYSQEDMEPLNSGRVSLISGVPTDALRQDIQRYIKSLFNIDIELDNIFPVYGPTMRFKNQYLLQFKTPEEANAVVTHETQAKYRFSKDSEIRITKVNSLKIAIMFIEMIRQLMCLTIVSKNMQLQNMDYKKQKKQIVHFF